MQLRSKTREGAAPAPSPSQSTRLSPPVHPPKATASTSHTQSSGIIQLVVCVAGIYGSFLIWAICQEKVSTTYYERIDGTGRDRFMNVLFMNIIQSALSVVSAAVYIYFVSPAEARASWWRMLGLPADRSWRTLLSGYGVVSLLSTLSSPFGFLALSHISFLTLLLGKSCKLIPVMLVHVLVYRQRLPLSKYVIVILVTLGIYLFMAYDARAHRKKGAQSSSVYGLALLGVNLFLDGLVNSTQDRIIERFKIKGHHMMFFMNLLSTLITAVALAAPTSVLPGTWALASPGHLNGFHAAVRFLALHPAAIRDILLFGVTGAVGQIFIFRTLVLYGSLTLVTITVTRKMMTMILSVLLFGHALTGVQWLGVGVVFAGILLEAELKRRKTRK